VAVEGIVRPDHTHCLWTLPQGDADFPGRWGAIKIAFVKSRQPWAEAFLLGRSRRGQHWGPSAVWAGQRSDSPPEPLCARRCFSAKAHTSEEKMDQTRAREMAKDAAEQAGKTATDAAKRVGEQVQPAFDQGKAVVQDLANQASEVGRQAVDRAGEFVEGVAPQARQAARNLYEQGARSGAYVREYAAQEPVVAMLIAGVIGFAFGHLLRGATNRSDRAG